MQKLKVLDLFSGIGGFSLGLERTGGFETVAFCEIDPFCQKVLKKHWPEVPIYEDVRTLEHEGSVDLICGGFPCQPFSTAGKRRGTEDDRHLWPAMLVLVETHRPAWFIGENVAGLTSMELNRGNIKVESRTNTRYSNHDFYEAIYTRKSTMLLNNLIKDLESIGYAVQPFIIPAVATDAKHRRDRIWIVANDDSKRCRTPRADQTQKRTTTSTCSTSEQSDIISYTRHSELPRRQDTAKIHRRSSGERFTKGDKSSSSCTDLADTTSQRQPRSRKFIEQLRKEQNREGKTDYVIPIGEPCFWPAEPAVGRVADGIPQRVDRLRGLGNAVVPQIPEIIGDAILQSLEGTKNDN